jgi:hypothetical protein
VKRPDPDQLDVFEDAELEDDDLSFGEWVERLPVTPTATTTATSSWSLSISTRPDLKTIRRAA